MRKAISWGILVCAVAAASATPDAVGALGETYDIVGHVRDPRGVSLVGAVVSDGSSSSTTTGDGYRLKEQLAGTYTSRRLVKTLSLARPA